MARFLIELEHEPDKEACIVAVETMLSSGSHFLTNAEFGCIDDDHRCWIIIDVDSREEAKAILPPIYRNEAKIIQLMHYTMDSLQDAIKNDAF